MFHSLTGLERETLNFSVRQGAEALVFNSGFLLDSLKGHILGIRVNWKEIRPRND